MVARVRHAGMAKKLKRDVGTARRALAHRPEVALRLPADAAPTKEQVTAWTKALEACWALDASWSGERWRAFAHGWPAVSDVAGRLVWRADGVGAFRGTPGTFVDADDRPVEVPDEAAVRLWHPAAAAEDERERWRDHVRRHRVEQPLRQVFREHYDAAEPGLADLVCDARPFVGRRARRRGGRSDGDGLERVAGAVMAVLHANGPLYPGAEGTVAVGGVSVGWVGRHPDPRLAVDGARPGVARPPATRRPRLGAPALRGPGGLRVGDHAGRACAGDPGSERVVSPGGVLETRRTILRHVLADLPAQDRTRLTVDARHVVVGEHRVHLTTGRVTRDGDPVDLAPAARAGLWMPVSDPLLSEIVGLVVALLRE